VQAVEAYREAGSLRRVADIQLLQGVAALMEGKHSALYAAFRTCALETRFSGSDAMGVSWLALVAASWVTRGAPRRAARLFAAAGSLYPIGETLLGPFVKLLEASLDVGRSQTDERTWEDAWEEGRAMTLNEAVAYALDESGRDH
jgi:hypothetical protein